MLCRFGEPLQLSEQLHSLLQQRLHSICQLGSQQTNSPINLSCQALDSLIPCTETSQTSQQARGRCAHVAMQPAHACLTYRISHSSRQCHEDAQWLSTKSICKHALVMTAGGH